MNNQQLEIIVQSLRREELCDYIDETYHQAMKKLKQNIAMGLKSMHHPLEQEDLAKLKSTFLSYEIMIDSIIQDEKTLLPFVCEAGKLSDHTQIQLIEESLSLKYEKEMKIASTIKELLHGFSIKCQVYSLLEELTFKSEDRIDLFQHHIKELLR